MLAWHFLIDPVGSFALDFSSSHIAIAFYVLTAAIIVLLTASMQRALLEAERAHAELRSANEALETRVARRTAELEAANRQLRDEAKSRATAEAQMRQLQRMEALNQLTAGLAHDFNNALAIVVGSLDIVKRHLDRNVDRVRQCLDSASEGARCAAEITARLLAFSRQQALEPVALDLNKLVAGTSELLVRTLGETVKIETVLGAGVWQTFADANQLSSALVIYALTHGMPCRTAAG